jgi:transcriptional regulator with XRE-family HTH domain
MDTVTGSFVHELEHADSVCWMRHRCHGCLVSLGERRQGYNHGVTLGGMAFGRLLREYREHRGWSLGELSRATHFSRGYLSNIENGRKPATEALARLCDEALRANGVLITAAGDDLVARLDRTPWQTAELVQRLQASDATPATLERLHATLVELCCQYSWRDALELREEAQGWLRHVLARSAVPPGPSTRLGTGAFIPERHRRGSRRHLERAAASGDEREGPRRLRRDARNHFSSTRPGRHGTRVYSSSRRRRSPAPRAGGSRHRRPRRRSDRR